MLPTVIPHYKADSYVLLTRLPLTNLANQIHSFDLHVLGMPPAFTLSQDQTLYSHYLPIQKSFTTHRAFITHAALLDQAFAHCPIFPTAASRRSLGRFSVPVWLIILSDQLKIVALVSFYLTNKLILRGLILRR